MGCAGSTAACLSAWLVDEVAPGDVVEVGPPAGSFTPELTAGTHHGLVAAGSGITPVLSIAASLLAAHDDTRVTLVYGNRRTDTVMFTEEIADLKNRYGPRLHLLHVLSREPTEAEIVNGRLDADRLRLLFTALVDTGDVDDWWLCGPLGMTEAAVAVLGELGVERRRVAPRAVLRRRAAAGARPPRARAGRRRRTGHGRPERTVDDAGRPGRGVRPRRRAEGPRRPAVRLQGRGVRDLPGEGDRRRGDHAAQLRAGARGGRRRFVLTCQSRPVTGTATVDYDA